MKLNQKTEKNEQKNELRFRSKQCSFSLYLFFSNLGTKQRFLNSHFSVLLLSLSTFVASLSLSATNEGANVEKPDRKSVNQK